MYIMNNIIKYVLFYTWTLTIIRVIALPISSEVIESATDYGVIPKGNIHTETNEDFYNDEADVNRSKKSATTFCVEIKSGTPEYVPCQPVMMGIQPQMVYVTDNNTCPDCSKINNTVTLRQGELDLPPEPPCPKDDIFFILPPQQYQPSVSLVQVPVVHNVPQSPQILVATRPFLEAHFPEFLNESHVQIQPLRPVDESGSIIDPQFSQYLQPSANTFVKNKNNNWNVNLDSKENTFPQVVMPSGFKLLKPSEDQGIGGNFEFGVGGQNQPPFLQPPEYQNIGPNIKYATEPQQQQPSSIGSLENHRIGTNFGYGVGVRNQPPFLQPSEHQNIGLNFKYGTGPQQNPSIGPLKNPGMGQNFGFGIGVQNQSPENQSIGQNVKYGIEPQKRPPSIGSLENHGIGANFGFGVGDRNQPPFLQPLEPQNIGLNFKYGTEPQKNPPSIGSLENHGIGANFGFGIGVQNQPPEHQNIGLNFKYETEPQQNPPSIGPVKNQGIGANFGFGVGVQNQPPLLQPSEHQNMGQHLKHDAESQQHPPSIGSLTNHGMGQNFGFDNEAQHQPPFMINQQGSAFNTRLLPPQQYSPLSMNNHANGRLFINGGVGQFPIQEPVKSQRPVNANDFQSRPDYFSNQNIVMEQDENGYYLMPAMMNGNPQLCLQPEPITSPQLNNINQQSSIQRQNLPTSDSQQSSLSNKQWSSREIKDSKGTLQIPEAQTTVAPIKSGLKSQDVKGKGGSSSQLNHLKGPSSLSKTKTFGKGQNKDSKSNEKPELKRGNKRETEISVDK